jgi:hypothetical protein
MGMPNDLSAGYANEGKLSITFETTTISPKPENEAEIIPVEEL